MGASYSYPGNTYIRTYQVVTDQSDLTGTLDSNVIYFIDGFITMQQSITVPSGGLFMFSTDANQGGLDCAGAFPLFTGGGNLFTRNIKLSASATGSQVFDLTAASAFDAVEFSDTNFENVESLGEITGYRQGLFNNVAVFSWKDGLTLSGAWAGGFRIATFIARVYEGTAGTLFKEGTSLTFASRFASDGNVDIPATATGYSFSPSNFTNDQDFQLLGGVFSGAGTYVSGIDVTSTKSLWSSVNLPVTRPGGRLTFTAAAATTIGATNTPVKAAGTTVLDDNIWCTQTANNRVRWDSEGSAASVRVYGVLSITSGNNNQIGILLRVYDELNVLQESFEFPSITANGAGRAENITVAQFFDIQKDWYIEVWVENQTATTDITIENNSVLLIEQRKAV